MKKETMLEAFLRQSKIDPNSFEQSEEHEELYGEGRNEGTVEKAETQRLRSQAGANMFNPKPISAIVDIPTQLNSEELNQKTESSKQFKNYDHSLEEVRWRKIGGLDCEGDRDGGNSSIEMEEI